MIDSFSTFSCLLGFLPQFPSSGMPNDGCPAQVGACFLDSVASVIAGVVLVAGTIIGDASDDFFRIVAPGQCPFCVRPVVLRLAQMAAGDGLFASELVTPGCIVGVDLQLE